MKPGSLARTMVTVVWAVLLTACASAPAGIELPAGTWMLGEVRHALTRAMVEAGDFAPGDTREGLAETLHGQGFTDAQIDAGRVFVVRDRIDWNNTVSGIKHGVLRPALVVEGLVVEPGNVVEIEVSPQQPWPMVRRVRAASLAAGGCFYGDVPVGPAVEALGVLSLVGPRGSASLYCAGIENEGWQRPRTYWHKLPGATMASPATPVPIPVEPDEASSAPPASAPATDGMATLLLYLTPSRTTLPFLFALPFWIDDEKVAALDHGECELILVPPGTHRVVAGNPGTGLLRTHGQRELNVSVGAGDRLVLEYRVDVDAQEQSERFFEWRGKWDARIYHFTQRPATPRDACAIRHMPTKLGQ